MQACFFSEFDAELLTCCIVQILLLQFAADFRSSVNVACCVWNVAASYDVWSSDALSSYDWSASASKETDSKFELWQQVVKHVRVVSNNFIALNIVIKIQSTYCMRNWIEWRVRHSYLYVTCDICSSIIFIIELNSCHLSVSVIIQNRSVSAC